MSLPERFSPASFVGRLLRLPLRLVPADRPRRVLGGGARGMLWIPGSHTHGCWLGTYEKRTQKLLQRHIAPGSVVFDIGANVGYFTLLSARLAGDAGKVVAFEPLERNLSFLHRHVALNGMANVQVVAAAVGATSGHAFFAADRGPAMGSLASEGVRVSLVGLDDLLARGEIPVPTLLKIDVEGGEEGVIEGGRKMLEHARPTVLLSGHGWKRTHACTTLLGQLGYHVTFVRDGVQDGNYELLATPG